MDFKDYYATLGVAKAATDAEIRKAYRKLARKHHPDLNPGDKSAEAKFKEINEANEVLGDPEKRRKYDELGANWRAHEQTPPANGPFGGGRRGGSRAMSQDEMNEMFGGQDPFSDFFNTFFAGQQAGPQARDARGRKGRDLEETVTLTLEEAFSGTSRRASFNRAGQTRNVDIKIPAGVGEGARVRAAGEGGAASAGGKAGDLYLTVHIESHARFERRDRDLYVKMPVPVTTAILGGEIAVPTLSGSTLRLKVPELTSSGQMLRLRGHGMPAIGKPDVRGDLYATVSIVAPAALTPEMREHYTALKTLEGGQA